MQYVIHRTKGLLDIRATTIMGLHAKPNSDNPLGYFGTGLKYAIAVLLRNSLEVLLFIDGVEYVFYTKKGEFRGQEYDQIRMKKRTNWLAPWKYETLPYTLQLGRNWELWQAFRELETNTRDENGQTYTGETYAGSISQTLDDATPGHTLWVVKGQKYLDEFYDMGRTFLKEGLTERTSSEDIQVLEQPSKHIYYRGMRIMDLKHEALFTYNLLRHVDLTEDRTAKYPWMVEMFIVDMMQKSEDDSFLEKAVANPSRHSFEGTLPHSVPSVGRGSMAYRLSAESSTNPTVKEVWNQLQPSIPTSTHIQVTVPKAGLTDNELEVFGKMCADWFPGTTFYVPGAYNPEEVDF